MTFIGKFATLDTEESDDAMAYGERTEQAMAKAAESVPIRAQLEVNAEIFTTLRNIVAAGVAPSRERQLDLLRLGELRELTIQAIDDVENRMGYPPDVEEQLTMLTTALAIKDKYVPQIDFERTDKPAGDPPTPVPQETFDPAEADRVFDTQVWPLIGARAETGKAHPTAYIIGGQPGSGKSLIAASILAETNTDPVACDAHHLLGFHPQYEALQDRYGIYAIYITRYIAEYLAEAAFTRTIDIRADLLWESNLDNTADSLARLRRLKAAGYRVELHIRACSRDDAWLHLQYLYQQQLLKAAVLARILPYENYHAACDRFLETVTVLKDEPLDRLIVKSRKGLVYDSDDSPTEDVIALIRERLGTRK